MNVGGYSSAVGKNVLQNQRSGRVDFTIAAAAFAASAAVVVWQNLRLTVLWDLSYILENASRMAAGQAPYRDFPFPYAPLTFAIQALIIRVFGRAIWHHIAYAALAGGLATALAYFVIRRFVPRLAAVALILPLVPLGIYAIFPHPFYDPDACLLVLAIFCALLYSRSSHALFATGVAAMLTIFVKQNIGIAFVIALSGLSLLSRERRRYLPLLGGMLAGAAAAAGAVALLFGIHNYVRWTIDFAASRRLPSFAQYTGIYTENVIWWWIAAAIAGGIVMRWFRVAGGVIIAAPFVWTIVRIFVTDDPTEPEVNLLRFWPMLIVCGVVAGVIWLWRERTARGIVPLLAVATTAGAFLSQSDWGSTYGIWPMLIVTAAAGTALVCGDDSRTAAALAIVMSAALLFGGVPYTIDDDRLTYVKLEGDVRRSALPQLRGLSEAGEWLPEFEQLVAWTKANVPPDDGIICLPGEDLFYFTTGRRPHFPVLMFDRTINPYDARTIATLADERNIRWVIVKRRLQINGTPMENLAETLALLQRKFGRVAELANYEIYRRK